MKTFIAVAANEQFKVCSVDITGAFLQADKIDREVFIRPPTDIKKANPGILWKLNKPIYGLDDSSRKFYLKVKKLFLKHGMEVMPADNAYFYLRKDGRLVGQVAIHVDDFFIGGEDTFNDWFLKMVADNLEISKVEHGAFRFTGVDIKQEKDKIIVSMNDYVDSLEPIKDFRKDENTSKLNDLEMKIYRKYTGKLMWLTENCRPDLAFMTNKMSKKSHEATLSDLKYVNNVLKRVRGRENEVVYTKVGEKEDLVIKSMSDASYMRVKESVGGSIVMLASTKNNSVVPLYWKSKSIIKVSTSTKDEETHALFKNVADAAFAVTNIETLLYGDYQKKIKVEVYIDKKPLLESVASTKIVENKFLVSEINAMKQLIEDETIKHITWVDTKDQLADVLTKEMVEPKKIRDVFLRNNFDFKVFDRNPKAKLKFHDKGTDDESKEIKLENNDKK